MPERVLDLNTVQFDVQTGRWSAAAWMRIAALPRCSFNRLPAVFRERALAS
jgi:hypothetical protein